MDASIYAQLAITLFLVIFIPAYLKTYDWQCFLWLSDIGVFLTFFALWLSSPLLNSIAAVAIMPFELAWTVDYLFLLAGRTLLGSCNYMKDTSYPLFVRLLSLFHVVLPVVWIYYLGKWGYDARAFPLSCVLLFGALLASYLFTSVKNNTNWVFHPTLHNWKWINQPLWVLLLMTFIPIFVYLPFHTLLYLIYG